MEVDDGAILSRASEPFFCVSQVRLMGLRVSLSLVQRHRESSSNSHTPSAWISVEDTAVLVGRRLGSGCIPLHPDIHRLYAYFLQKLQVFRVLGDSQVDTRSCLVTDHTDEQVVIAGWINAYMFTSIVWYVPFVVSWFNETH